MVPWGLMLEGTLELPTWVANFNNLVTLAGFAVLALLALGAGSSDPNLEQPTCAQIAVVILTAIVAILLGLGVFIIPVLYGLVFIVKRYRIVKR